MLSVETLITFAVASAILSISPGPSNLYIMARSMGQGHSAGAAAAGGMAIGTMIYVVATALGIAAIFKYSPLAYTLVKFAGAGYLIYLGVSYFIHAKAGVGEKQHLKPMTTKNIFRQSIVVELTNPKTALFFLAFLPQFVEVGAQNVALQLVILGCIYGIIAFSCDMLVVLLSTQLGKWLMQHPMFVAWQERISGSILAGLGGYIIYDDLTTKPAS